jgi:hypothetical protein
MDYNKITEVIEVPDIPTARLSGKVSDHACVEATAVEPTAVALNVVADSDTRRSERCHDATDRINHRRNTDQTFKVLTDEMYRQANRKNVLKTKRDGKKRRSVSPPGIRINGF